MVEQMLVDLFDGKRIRKANHKFMEERGVRVHRETWDGGDLLGGIMGFLVAQFGYLRRPCLPTRLR